MGGLFSKPKKPKPVELPPPPPVEPPPPVVDTKVGETVRRRGRTGRQATFLTGDLVPNTGKKRTLG